MQYLFNICYEYHFFMKVLIRLPTNTLGIPYFLTSVTNTFPHIIVVWVFTVNNMCKVILIVIMVLMVNIYAAVQLFQQILLVIHSSLIYSKTLMFFISLLFPVCCPDMDDDNNSFNYLSININNWLICMHCRQLQLYSCFLQAKLKKLHVLWKMWPMSSSLATKSGFLNVSSSIITVNGRNHILLTSL